MNNKKLQRAAFSFALAGILGFTSGYSFTASAESLMTEEQGEMNSGAGAPQMSYDEFPRIDGSLACVPLIEALAMECTGCTELMAEDLLSDFANTNDSYVKLADGRCDILLAYEPADSTVEELKEYPALDMESIGSDALVFITNRSNPVESLSISQLTDIFTGKLVNWKEAGGEDIEIKVFSRPERSGSHTLLKKLLLQGQTLTEGVFEEVPSMEGIISMLKEYDNSANAIGYSVFYYASMMFAQPDLKFLGVDGVMPSNESIRSGEYPLVNDFYVVTGSSPSDHVKEIRSWLLSDEGQRFVEECGYVPVR